MTIPPVTPAGMFAQQPVAHGTRPYAAAPPLQQPTFHILNLRRPSLAVPWGLSVSMFEGRFVVIGNVNGDRIGGFVLSHWAATAPIEPRLAWDRSRPLNVAALRQYLLSQQNQPQVRKKAIPITPGDCIVGINGENILQYASLQQLTHLLRNSIHLQLLILRLPSAIWQARSVWAQVEQHQQQSMNNQNPQKQPLPPQVLASPPYHAALEGYRALRQLYSQPRPIATPYPLPSSTALSTIAPVPTKNLKRPPTYALTPPSLPVTHTNNMFRDENGKPLPFADNWEFEPDEGRRAHLFLSKIDASNFDSWLRGRQSKWRKSYKVYPVEDIVDDESANAVYKKSCLDRQESNVPVDFWSAQGYSSFSHWQKVSTFNWKQTYSWNKKKRKRLEHACEEVVHLDTGDFDEWLHVRKNQWKILRRKRQRQRLDQARSSIASSTSADFCCSLLSMASLKQDGSTQPSPTSVMRPLAFTEATTVAQQPELVVIDALLEKQERERRALEGRPPLDVSFLFDARLGCPDDTVVHILSHLDPMEYGKLLCLSRKTRLGFQKRNEVWRHLCPSHWKLPRRPRKPWHELYFKNLRVEKELSQKKWDELLSKASNLLLKGDHLQTFEKLVLEAEREYRFNVNYTSGVMCERNSLLNLAVIHQRHKVVRWLVDAKGADIETCDRGNFTPLLNAAWAGDKYLVRFFLQKGSDRSKLGTCHYTKPLASPDFQGLTAADWALKNGFDEVATLIRIGL